MKLWHEGAPFRKPGELLLPPSETGFLATSGAISRAEGHSAITYREDRVYVTSDRDAGMAFAAYWTCRSPKQPGSLYEIQVEDDLLEPDTDLISSPGLAFQVPAARVVAIEARWVKWLPVHQAKILDLLRRNEAARLAKVALRESQEV